MRKVAHESGEIKLRRWESGEVIATQSWRGMRGQWWGLRNDLRRFLYDTAVESGAVVYYGRRAKSVDLKGPTATFEDGEVVRCDLLVGADGHFLFHDLRGELRVYRHQLGNPNSDASLSQTKGSGPVRLSGIGTSRSHV